jgi:hypothetical protein
MYVNDEEESTITSIKIQQIQIQDRYNNKIRTQQVERKCAFSHECRLESVENSRPAKKEKKRSPLFLKPNFNKKEETCIL